MQHLQGIRHGRIWLGQLEFYVFTLALLYVAVEDLCNKYSTTYRAGIMCCRHTIFKSGEDQACRGKIKLRYIEDTYISFKLSYFLKSGGSRSLQKHSLSAIIPAMRQHMP